MNVVRTAVTGSVLAAGIGTAVAVGKVGHEHGRANRSPMPEDFKTVDITLLGAMSAGPAVAGAGIAAAMLQKAANPLVRATAALALVGASAGAGYRIGETQGRHEARAEHCATTPVYADPNCDFDPYQPGRRR